MDISPLESLPPQQAVTPSYDRRKLTFWFPMRITYGRNERMYRIQELLDREKLEYFLPMRLEYEKTPDWDIRKQYVPAIHGLIFIHSTQEILTNLKMTRAEFQPMHYWTNHLAEDGNHRLLTIPDRQMNNFINLYSLQDDRTTLLEYTDFIAKPGKRVRITQGDFEGTVGTIKRIKKSQCVVVEIQGLTALAITFVPPSWLQELPESDYQSFMHSM